MGEHVHDEQCGHDHDYSRSEMSAGLWSALAMVIMAVLVVAIIVGARMMRRRSAGRVPCGNCGLFLEPDRDDVCPSCGKSTRGR
ncbi:MAG TPA: hypothetical protein PK280_05610 [Planctomycetota bacterium]|nr:hypothetical protein [Planctomycetota bacterium]